MEENEKNSTNSGLFRESSMERISSPEQLDDYIKVASPGVWLILCAIVALLLGFIVWAGNVSIVTAVDALVSSEQGVATCYVSEKYVNNGQVQVGMVVECNGQIFKISMIDGQALEANAVLSEYQRYVGKFSDGEWVYAMMLDPEFTDTGVFHADVIIQTTNPIEYLFQKNNEEE